MREALEREYGTIAEVAQSLGLVEDYCRHRSDRRGVFTTAYLVITGAVREGIDRGRFEDPAWVTRYLVTFGNLYRTALFEWECGDRASVPKSWRIAFEEAGRGSGLVTQHLLLGINAHINHDLALALDTIGIGPDRPTRYRDHTAVNDVLAEATPALKERVSTLYAPVLQRLDWIGGRLDDDFAGFSIVRAREHAWTFAVALAAAREPGERRLLVTALDEQAAVLATLILSRPTRHPVLMRAVRAAEQVDRALRKFGSVFARPRA